MRYLNWTLFLLGSLFSCLPVTAQPKEYAATNAHSHNDYLNASPFYLAYKNGFGSIEADIFPVDGILFVAHHKSGIKPSLTLNALYLRPLLSEFTAGGPRKLSLLIDIKENYDLSLSLLIKELEPLKQFLSTQAKQNYLTIVISGARPAPAAYGKYPDFIFFDDDLRLTHTPEEWKRVALVSLEFSRASNWNGETPLDEGNRKAIAYIIDSVHAAGKPIRFWGAPDTQLSWKVQMELHADLIGTDKIKELGDFIKNEAVHK